MKCSFPYYKNISAFSTLPTQFLKCYPTSLHTVYAFDSEKQLYIYIYIYTFINILQWDETGMDYRTIYKLFKDREKWAGLV
jgi:hypothetical protein